MFTLYHSHSVPVTEYDTVNPFSSFFNNEDGGRTHMYLDLCIYVFLCLCIHTLTLVPLTVYE